MPQYCYESKSGKLVERTFSIKDDIPKEIIVGKITYKRCFQAESASTMGSAGWPMTCVASGVHPDQAQALRDEFKRVGVPTEVTKGGDPIYRDARHRKKALTARGLHDKSSFS